MNVYITYGTYYFKKDNSTGIMKHAKTRKYN